MPLLPCRVDRLELATHHGARELAVAARDQLDEDRVVDDRRVAAIEEHMNQLGVLVGEARERVEEQLERDVLRGVNHRPHEGDVPARERDGIPHPVSLLVGARPHRVEVGLGPPRRGEPDGLGCDDPADLQERDDELAPRRIFGAKAANPRRERVEPRTLAPVGHDRAGAVARRDEAERLEPGQRRAQRESVDPEGEGELPLGRNLHAGWQATGEDLPAQAVGHGVDDRRSGDRNEAGESVCRRGVRGERRGAHTVLEWFNHSAHNRRTRNEIRGAGSIVLREMTRLCPSFIDLRSDTVTRPTLAMREAMANAVVGDDVYGEDPTVQALEEEVAAVMGKETALFVTSGTMGNQLAIACQTRPGDEIIIGEEAHLAFNEVGAAAALSGVQFVVAGTGGFFGAADVVALAKPDAYYYPRTSLVALENTHNRAGGKVLAHAQASGVAAAAKGLGLGCHLDGARIWNASVATGLAVAELAAPFDTVSVCFSKGLGAPVGSALVGTRDLVRHARRLRKMWGGGMRQAGILAAGALHAFVHHRARLPEDHANARHFALGLASTEGVRVRMDEVVTNIVNVDLDALDATAVVVAVRARGVALSATGPRRLRVVTHLDVSREEVSLAAARLSEVVTELGRQASGAPG